MKVSLYLSMRLEEEFAGLLEWQSGGSPNLAGEPGGKLQPYKPDVTLGSSLYFLTVRGISFPLSKMQK